MGELDPPIKLPALDECAGCFGVEEWSLCSGERRSGLMAMAISSRPDPRQRAPGAGPGVDIDIVPAVPAEPGKLGAALITNQAVGREKILPQLLCQHARKGARKSGEGSAGCHCLIFRHGGDAIQRKTDDNPSPSVLFCYSCGPQDSELLRHVR